MRQASPSTRWRADHPVVGVIGGMGPEATVALMRRVLAATPACDDADHIHMIVDNNPKVPSRIRALIEGTGEDPAPHLAAMARRLEAAGADFLVMPCNTAHHFHAAIADAVTVPAWNLVAMTIDRIAALTPPVRRVGVLASPAIRLTGLFDAPAATAGLDLVFPEPQRQDAVLATIRAVKAGALDAAQLAAYGDAARSLEAAGADALLLACTELSVIADRLAATVPVVDNLQLLAEAIVHAATAP